MKSIVFSIIFFGINNPRNIPKGPKITPSNEGDINNIKKKASSLKGEINNPKNLEIMGEVVKTLARSHRSVALGHVIATLIDFTNKNLMHSDNDSDTNPLSLVHHNETISGERIWITKTHAYIGGQYKRKLKSLVSGPLHTVNKKILADSRMDFLDPKYRKDLKGITGVNQRTTMFLKTRTFLTLKDMKELISVDNKEYGNKIKNQNKIRLEKKDFDELVKERLKNYQRNDTLLNSEITIRAGLLSTKTQLKIANRLPLYDSHIMIHLVYLKHMNECVTVEKLVERIKSEYVLKNRIGNIKMANELIEVIDSKEVDFSTQLITQLNIRPVETSSFKEHCTIAKTWMRKLPSNGLWEFNLKERHTEGVSINQLEKIRSELKDENDKNMPLSFFFIVEFFGDRRGSITRLEDNESISGVYTPCALNFDFKLEIKHLSKNEMDKIDEIMNFNEIRGVKEFDDKSLAEEFYPTRIGDFNISYKDICIYNREKDKDKDKKYKLDVSNSILDSEQTSLFEKLIEQAKKIDPELGNQFTPDDMPFRTGGTRNNLRGDSSGNNDEQYDSYDEYDEYEEDNS